ncbi:hypothetical protein FB451DRAFT_1246168 [Mycena latifolia]|nr:hypothetical protein FB451DRAFT_1246168 [Mycena latifolia]
MSNLNMHLMCTNCFRNSSDEPDLKLFRYSKCKGVLYCSRECQMKHWPTHKKTCSLVDDSGIFALAQNFYSNPFLNTLLQACFVLHFDLLRQPQLDEPFLAQVAFGIEPVDMADFFTLFIGNQPLEKKIEGVVQINAFSPLTPDEAAKITTGKKMVWRKAKEEASRTGLVAQSVGLVEFGTGDNGQCLTFPILIGGDAMDLVRASAPWKIPSGIKGEVADVPFSIETCMEFMNLRSREDRDNKLLLRTEMRPSDIRFIRDATQPSGHSLPVQRFMVKMAREQVFKPILDMLRKLADLRTADPTMKKVVILR